MHGVERNAHEWGVGDSEDVARLEFRHPNEGKDLPLRGDKVFLQCGQIRVGEHVDQIVPGERLRAIDTKQIYCKQLWLVGQGDAYCAIVSKMEASTQSNGVYGISPHAYRGVVR